MSKGFFTKHWIGFTDPEESTQGKCIHTDLRQDDDTSVRYTAVSWKERKENGVRTVVPDSVVYHDDEENRKRLWLASHGWCTKASTGGDAELLSLVSLYGVSGATESIKAQREKFARLLDDETKALLETEHPHLLARVEASSEGSDQPGMVTDTEALEAGEQWLRDQTAVIAVQKTALDRMLGAPDSELFTWLQENAGSGDGSLGDEEGLYEPNQLFLIEQLGSLDSLREPQGHNIRPIIEAVMMVSKNDPRVSVEALSALPFSGSNV